MKQFSAISTPDTPDQPWRSLHVFNIYRLIIAGAIALIFFLATPDTVSFGKSHPKIFAATIVCWLLISLVSGFASRLRWKRFRWQVAIIILLDILFITLLIYSSGGAESGLGTLMLVTIAASGILISGRMTFAFAALATLALLFMHGYSVLAGIEPTVAGYTRIGLLGAGLFAVALLTHILALRIRESEALAQQRGQDLFDLTQINELIIQQMDTGVLVVSNNRKILMLNDAAQRMLNIDDNNKEMSLDAASPRLAEYFHAWKQSSGNEPGPFRGTIGGAELLPRFTRIGDESSSATAVFLEDAAQLAHQAQQIKLASLGRLTASIAHEIRNPLSAIQHAGQLLSESGHKDAQDARLTEIIQKQSERLNIIVENVLSLSRKKDFKPQAMKLGPWLENFYAGMLAQHKLDPSEAELNINNADQTIQFDHSHLEQILCNLCDNAVRHSQDHSSGKHKITLSCGIDPGTNTMEINVTDSGTGIEEEHVEKLFEPFFTTESTGTGLGLYIARELCELNHARLTYRESDQGGAQFNLSFSSPENID